MGVLPAPLLLSLSLFTIFHMDLHRWNALVRPGVTRNIRIPPAPEQSTPVLHCSVASRGRSVPDSETGTGDRG